MELNKRRRCARALGFGVLALSVLMGSRAEAKSPIRNVKSLESVLRQADQAIERKHRNLIRDLKREARKTKVSRDWEVWVELNHRLRLDPDDKAVLRELEAEPPLREDPPSKGYAADRGKLDKEAAERYASILKRGVDGELTKAELAGVAQRVLVYDQHNAQAREVLGFEGSARQGWVSAHESELRGRYREALRRASPGRASRGVPGLEKALGLRLQFWETERVIIAGVGASRRAYEEVARATEVAYAALHHDFFGVDGIFKSPGDRAATGGKPDKPLSRPVFLMLDNGRQHQRYLDRLITDANLKIRGKTLGFVSCRWGPKKVQIFESRSSRRNLAEWSAMMMTRVFLAERFGQDRPPFLAQGIGHYYAGHISGGARLVVVTLGTMSDDEKRTMRSGPYSLFRSQARYALQRFLGTGPRFALFRPLEALSRGDITISAGFVDYCLAEKRDALILLLQKAGPEADRAALAREAFGADMEAVEKDFRAWLARQY